MWAGLLRLPPSKLCLNSDGEGKAGPRLVESTFSQSGDRYLVCTGSSISFNLCFNFPSPVCFPLSSGRNPNITLQPPPPRHITPKAQSKQNLSLFCFATQRQTPISALAHVRETVHVAKCLNPPLLCLCCPGLAIPPRCLSAIYI